MESLSLSQVSDLASMIHIDDFVQILKETHRGLGILTIGTPI